MRLLTLAAAVALSSMTASHAAAQALCNLSSNGVTDGNGYSMAVATVAELRKSVYDGRLMAPEGRITLRLPAPKLLPQDSYPTTDPSLSVGDDLVRLAVLRFSVDASKIWNISLEMPTGESLSGLYRNATPIVSNIYIGHNVTPLEATSQNDGKRVWSFTSYDAGFGQIINQDITIYFYDGRTSDRGVILAGLHFPAQAFVDSFGRVRRNMATLIENERSGRCVAGTAG